MSTLTITVSTKAMDGTQLDTEELTLDVDSLRTVPNPRQMLVAHFLEMTREVVAEVDPSINI